MLYTDLYTKKNKKLPLLIAVVVCLLGVATFWKLFTPKNTITSLNPGLTSVEITNVFQNQTTIIWKTDRSDKGWLLYGEFEVDMDSVAYDDRDSVAMQKKYLYHVTTLKDLKPDTRYFFKLTNGKEYYEQNRRSLFTFKTTGKIGQSATTQPAYGKLVDKKSSPVGGAIVILAGSDLYPLSTLTKPSGEWLIPLNFTISKKTNKLKTLTQNDDVVIYFFAQDGKTSKATAKLRHLSPLEKSLVIGESVTLSSASTSKPTVDASDKGQDVVTIIYPKKNAVIAVGKPLIKGTAPSGKKVEITLSNRTTSKSYTVIANSDGLWSLGLSKNLGPSEYKVAARLVDTDANSPLITRVFNVAKGGTSVLGDSTPSATLTPTLTPSPTTTPTATPSGTLTPTITISQLPTLAPTVPPQITNTPAPTLPPIESLTTTPTPPVAGISMYGLAATSAVLMLVGAGLLVIF